jgi:hypothetical protein
MPWSSCFLWLERTPAQPLDFGVNFRLSQHVIPDVGLNLGLNSAAPKAQVYTGISARF